MVVMPPRPVVRVARQRSRQIPSISVASRLRMRGDHDLVERGLDGAQAGGEEVQVAHAGDAVIGVDFDHQQITHGGQGVAVHQPGVWPGEACGGDADVGYLHGVPL